MNAKKYGTNAEQLRWSAGWKNPTQRRAADLESRCRDCGYLVDANAVSHLNGAPKCLLLGLATRGNATCNRYQPPVTVAVIGHHEEESE